MTALEAYRELVERVDAMAERVGALFAGSMSCRRGCSGCCRHLAVFPVEAAALAAALEGLPPAEREVLRRRGREAAPDGPCPLLDGEGACLLYPVRPLICRTQGLPLLIGSAGGAEGPSAGSGSGRSIDFCPLNFAGVDTFPGEAVLDLDRLNRMLAMVNALFLQESGEPDRRLTLAQVLSR